MFQRLKGAIDSRIAEEQARQRQATLSVTPQRSAPEKARGRASQNRSPARRPSAQRTGKDGQPGKEPDPSEFEPEFTIGDDGSEPSRTPTPRPGLKDATADTLAKAEAGSEDARGERPQKGEIENSDLVADGPAVEHSESTELPADVKARLQKLAWLESRYLELLKAYRTAHSRVQAIGPFEASLREHTPLTSIAEPGALVEYLNQINLRGDMVLQELKRVTNDGEDTKKKLEVTQREREELREEISRLKLRVPTAHSVNGEVGETAEIALPGRPTEEPPGKENEGSPIAIKSPTGSVTSRVPSFSLFSPKAKAKSPPPRESEEFFSYDSEVPRLENELRERELVITDLEKEARSLRGDLAVARESTGSMVQSLESATRELHILRDSTDKFNVLKKEMQYKIDGLEAKIEEGLAYRGELETRLEEKRTEMQQYNDRQMSLEKQIQKLEERAKVSQEALVAEERGSADLREHLRQKDATVKDLEDSLAMAKLAERDEARRPEEDLGQTRIAAMQNTIDSLRAQLDDAEKTIAGLKQQILKNQEAFANMPSSKIFNFLKDHTDTEFETIDNREDLIRYLALRLDVSSPVSNRATDTTANEPAQESATLNGGKKKNKKKKKGKAGQRDGTSDPTQSDGPQKVTEDLADVDDGPPATSVRGDSLSVRLEFEISKLREEITTKEATIHRLTESIRDQGALREEIETLRDDLLHQGEEHVEARDMLKTTQTEKNVLQGLVDELQRKHAEAAAQTAIAATSEQVHKDLVAQFDELQSKCTILQTDLAAAEQLAAARFKDITDLRDLLSKAQPELRSLRSEVAELKSTKDDLKNKTGDFTRLEARHEDIKAEMKGLAKRLGDKDSEIKELQQRLERDTSSKTRLEEDLRAAQSDLRYAEARKKEASDQALLTSTDLAAAKEESSRLKVKIGNLEEQLSLHNKQVAELRDELSLKTALHVTSQSLVQSLREQTHELSTQAREASSRAESLEEELAEAQRMLSERTREGQTMRMLLTQAETATEAKVRDMKGRMEAALEERDRAEEDASLQSRRVMREVEDARAKARNAASELKVAQEERDGLQDEQREWRRKTKELEEAAEKTAAEIGEVKSAMERLRDALDEAERQMEDLERQRNDLRARGDEARDRVEKLTKANRSLTDELKTAQGAARKPSMRPGLTSGVQSSRTSFDSSAPPRSPAPSNRSETPTGLNPAKLDYVYLKNVLLQFLEQRDKNHQKQLIPVLGMLLHFEKGEEQKWLSAVSAR